MSSIPVQMWKSKEGSVFPTRHEADAHDEALHVLRRHSFGDKQNFYKLLKEVLATHTLVPRAYPAPVEDD